MPLSRLENFLKNAEGNILYVNPSDFDATDGYENQGNSLTRPFRTIQRALIEAARFSYQNGRNNDKIDRTTILVYPGTHYIDNRPGFSIENISGSPVYKRRTSASTWTETTLTEFGRNTNFDILDVNNDLYKYNSALGGVILPRGTSIIGLDLRKTKIRPLYVPDPEDDSVEFSSIFNVTGTCYFSQFTFFDADITKEVYKNYSSNKFVPNYSHHKLVAFTYGDGVNKVVLADRQTDLTDLDMYYYKVAKAYGDFSGRGLVDFPTSQDFEPSIDEYRIVGTLQSNPLGIGSITSGDGIVSPLNLITVTTKDLKTGENKPHGLFVDSPVYVDGVTIDPGVYNGSFTVKDVVGVSTFTYLSNSSPAQVINYNDFSSATVLSESDTVSSASPYIFNCSIRSVYGISGMWADGSKADGFKSMVVAQFTGVSLQKDDNAFMIYQNGNYEDNFSLSINSPERPLHSNSLSRYKPKYENYHIRVSDGGFVQCVSIFAIGYSKHFVTESGGDMSITNSNSNFGAISLQSTGFRNESFDRDDVGYITHVIPPRELREVESEISWLPIDVEKTISIGDTSKLYLYSYNDPNVSPNHEIDGYRIGAKLNDILYLILPEGTVQKIYSTPILMTVPSGTGIQTKKEYNVATSGSLNSINTNGVITLQSAHQLFNGESIRIFSDDGIAPDNIECDVVYFAITSTINPALSSTQIQLAYSLNDAISGVKINGIGNNGGKLKIISSVSDKFPGEYGHPVQYDSTNSNWYVVGAATSTQNGIYKGLVDVGLIAIGNESPSTFISRALDNRSIEDKIYKFRYVIPKEFEFARPPQPGFVIQESKTVSTSPISFNENETLTKFTPPEYLRNEKIIVNVSSGSVSSGKQTITVKTEKPHGLLIGDKVKITKVTSTNNPTGLGLTSTYNGSFYVNSVQTGKEFTYELSGVKINPGTFTNKINERDTNAERESLPLFSREEYKNTFYIYRVNTIRKHVPGVNGQDGIYHIITLSSNVSAPDGINFNVSEKQFSQDVRNLYPQLDRDNYDFDPLSAVSSTDLKVLGKVLTNDKRKSLTKETLEYFIRNTRTAFGIVNVIATGVGNTTVTLYTDIEHGLNSIKDLTISVAGAGYGNTTIYSSNLVGAAGTNASVRALLTTGSVSGINIVDSGCGYAVNDSLTLTAPLGISPSQTAVLTVLEINNNVNDGLELTGFGEKEFNGTFRILSVPGPKSVQVYIPSVSSIPVIDPSGKKIPLGTLASKGIGISTFSFNPPSSGIATVTTQSSHGLLPGNKFTIVGSGSSVYDGTFTVNSLDLTSPLTKFDFYVGISTVSPQSTTGILLKSTFSANSSSLGQGEENLGSRVSYIYAGITTTTISALNTSSSTIQLSSTLGFGRGDYIIINSEIIRLASAPIGSSFNIIRGLFGTYKTTAPIGTQIKKIKVIPVELRRPSFMRASGHTFEYLGYGPGNYSTAMPQKQNVTLSEDDVLTSQSRKERGGAVVYSAMNDLGEFFSGNKKQSSTTGEEKIVEAPILTYTGDDSRGNLSTRLNGIFDDVLVREKLTVEGGENNNQTTQFYGPVNFTQKVTNVSESGINTKKIFIRGKLQQGKQITIGIGTTSGLVQDDILNPKLGDIVLTNNPIPQKHIGFTYDGLNWQKFGLISQRPNFLDMRMDRLGIGDTSVFIPSGGVADKSLYVAGNAIFENIVVSSGAIFQSQVLLNDVRFNNLSIEGTATFDITGVGTDYTMIHKDGASLLNNLITAGISTFKREVNFDQNILGIGATFGNVRIGYASDNEIDTVSGSGNLTIDSAGGTVIVDDNLRITNGNFEIINGGTTSRLLNSNNLQIGIGTTTGTSSINLYERSNLGLSIARNAIGSGNTETSITHYGLSDFKIAAADLTNLSFYTDNKERIRVGLSGTITTYQNNAGEGLRGSHLKLNQSGAGDVSISWDVTYNNANVRWYSGIDVSDSNSWKLANPSTTLSYNSENWTNTDETKLKVSSNGDLNVYGNLFVDSIDGSSSASLGSRKQTFNFLDSNVTTLDIGKVATTISIGEQTNTSYVTIRGTKESNNKDTGALVVSGGVGIGKSLNVGGEFDSSSKSTGSLVVKGGVGIEKRLFVGSTDDTSSKDTGALVVEGGVGIEKRLFVGSTDDTSSKDTGALVVEGGVGIEKRLFVGSTSDTVSKTTGAVIIEGGVGIGKSLCIGSGIIVAQDVRASSFISTVSSGIAPLTVASNTKVVNLNSDLLDGLDSESFLRSDVDDSASGVIDFLGGTGATPAIRIKSGGSNWSEGLAIHPASNTGFALAFFRTSANLNEPLESWAIGNLGTNSTNNFGLIRNGLAGSVALRSDAVFDVTQAGVFRFGFNPTVGSNLILHAGNFNNYSPTLTGTGASGTWSINVTGNSGSATILQTTRTFSITGDIVAPAVNFNGNGNVVLNATIQANSVELGTDTTGNYVASITNGSYITGGNGGSESAALTIGVNASTSGTSNIVARDGSGNFSAGTITATLSGNSSTSTKLAAAVNINGVAFDGSAGITITANTPNNLSLGTYLSYDAGTTFNGGIARTINVSASTSGTSNIVARDSNGSFSAGTITATLSGNASTATKLAAAVNINGVAFDGSAGITITSSTSAALSLGTYLSYDAGTTFNGGIARTINVSASTSGTSNIVARDGSGNFSAGTITATLSGNAFTATTATRANGLNGGTTGNLAYQSSPDTTAFLVSPSGARRMLVYDGSSPTWTNIQYNVTTTNSNKTLGSFEYCTVTSDGLTITLPSNPSVGDSVMIGIGDNYTNTTVSRNGQNIMGLAENIIIDIPYLTLTFIYTNSQLGWRVSQ